MPGFTQGVSLKTAVGEDNNYLGIEKKSGRDYGLNTVRNIAGPRRRTSPIGSEFSFKPVGCGFFISTRSGDEVILEAIIITGKLNEVKKCIAVKIID